MSLPTEILMIWGSTLEAPGVSLRVNANRVLTSEELRLLSEAVETIEVFRENVAVPS